MAIPKILDHERKLKNIQDGQGELSIKEGASITASGEASHAEGYKTTAEGEASHAEGYDTTASGDYGSHAEGCDTVASGGDAHAEGYNTTASGEDAHAEGYFTTAFGDGSHAEGNSTIASGSYSHAEGYFTTAFGNRSHAEGSGTIATYENSHVQGRHNINGLFIEEIQTVTAGVSSSMSYYTSAQYTFDSSTGLFTLVDPVLGKLPTNPNIYYSLMPQNDSLQVFTSVTESSINGDTVTVNGTRQILISCSEKSYAHIVGNGTAEDARSNAHTLDWDGNAWFAGDVYVGSDSGTNKDDGSKKLATEEYVDNNGGIFWVTSETTFEELWSAWSMGKLLCIPPHGNGLNISETYICNGILAYDNEGSRVFTFGPATHNRDTNMIGMGHTIWCYEEYGWLYSEPSLQGNGAITTVHSVLIRHDANVVEYPLSTEPEPVYRPIYTSTREPTASDGKIGDIWIVYTE